MNLKHAVGLLMISWVCAASAEWEVFQSGKPWKVETVLEIRHATDAIHILCQGPEGQKEWISGVQRMVFRPSKRITEADLKAALPSNQAVTAPLQEIPPEMPIEQAVDVEAFYRYAGNLRGSSFISERRIDENVAHIRYHNSYEEYMKENPGSGISQEHFEGYWETGDAINKTLMQESIRLFKEFPMLRNPEDSSSESGNIRAANPEHSSSQSGGCGEQSERSDADLVNM
jgi:hypothetical protein